MKTNATTARMILVSGVLALYGSGVVAQTPDRSKKPDLGPVQQLTLPAVQQFALPNGLKVLVMEKRELPLVQLSLLIDAGTVREDAAAAGIANMTADMLDEGAAGKTALEIADAFEALGARFSVGGGLHTTTASLRVPVERLTPALQQMAEVVLQPSFPEEELDRLRKDRVTRLIRMHDQPQAIAASLFSSTLFGSQHPYGRNSIGTEQSLDAMSTAQLRAFYDRYYRPNNATVIVVGDLSAADARKAVEQAFGNWKRAEVPAVQLASAAQVKGRTIYIVDKPGSAQSVIQFGRIGVPRSTRDYYALEIMNTILGGSFTSRLNQNLRETHGYAYGASSGFDYRPIAGPWVAASNVQTVSTGPAISEFMNELRAIRQPIPQEEFERARNFLAMRFPQGFQSVAGIAGRLSDVVLYGLPTDYFNRYTQNVLAVTKADVERVAREYIDPENVAIFVVGDRKAIEEQVRAQNLGDVRFLTVTDVLGPVPQ